MPKTRDPALQGFPEDGDDLPDEPTPDLVEEQDDPGDADPPEDPLVTMRRTVEAQNAQIEQLRRQIPPAQPKPQAPPLEVKETDWDNLLFTKPKEAVEQIKRETRQEVASEMRAEYARDQGTQKFWNGFYSKHKDLNRDQDHDLIELTLNSNLSNLANIPVAEAMEKLADLTRERMIRYAGGVAKPKGKKAVVEGAGPPGNRKPKPPEAEITTLNDIIKARRNKRRGIAA